MNMHYGQIHLVHPLQYDSQTTSCCLVQQANTMLPYKRVQLITTAGKNYAFKI